MASGFTAFFSYLLVPASGFTNGNGYSEAIHCNYINSIFLNTITNKEINIHFNNISDFKFLCTSGGTGYSANDIYVLVQLIDNSTYANPAQVKPIAANWKKYKVTNQISGHISGNTLSEIDLTSSVFSVPLYSYNLMESYNLSYLDYPSHLSVDDNKLCFGDEIYFFGNVSSDIEAIAYTTDLPINLSLNEFNSSTNATWDQSTVYISEIGIYDNNKNLVGIAKLNNPISKDSTISRTIVFALDF